MNNCDHKFIDSNSCLKCGWTPTEDELHIKPPLPTPRTDALTELLSHSHGKSDGACFSEMKLLARELERELAESDEEIVRLTELNAFIANGSFKASEVMAKENTHLRFENERLKRGDFTKEEFQNLCHNRHEKEGCTAKDFFDGCAQFQKEMFGRSERDTIQSFLKDIANNYDCDSGAHGTHSPHCRSCEAKELLGLPNENSDQA